MALPEKKNPRQDKYKPSVKDDELIKFVYTELDEMLEERNKTWPQFNDRTLVGYIDDGEKRLNSYVLPKEVQDKEDWQANVALPTVRNKLKRMIAGFSLAVPDLEMRAFGENNTLDFDRADIAKNLIKGSYVQEENPVLENFWESWECAEKGTVIKYEGYLKTRYKQKFITKYDINTGEIESEEREVDVDDKCISYLLPLGEFYIRDFSVYDVQDQLSLIWARHYEKDNFEQEFGRYANAKYVKDIGSMDKADNQTFFKQRKYSTKAGKDQIEVLRYYKKITDQYIIVANGILLLDAPLLWRSNGNKVYPFAKSIFEPFTGKHFFYGNSLPNILLGEYDIQNTLWNTLLDKELRSLVKPLLIGQMNADAFDLEDELITRSTKIIVNDVNQAKELAIESVNQADIAMLQMVARGLDEDVPSIPDLLAQKQVTAREVVVAEEKLREIKSLYHEMLTDLWRQKYYLRLANIQLNYPQPRKIVDEKGKEAKLYRTFVIPNAVLEKDTNERGYLAVQFRTLTTADKKPAKFRTDEGKTIKTTVGALKTMEEEEMMKQQGVNYKKVIVSPNFLDNYRFQIEVMAESLYKTSLAKMQASVLEKLGAIAQFFPQVFVANQNEYFTQLAEAYDDDGGKYLEKLEQMRPPQGAGMPTEAGGSPLTPQTPTL